MYGLEYAYMSGAMYKGIASAKLVIAMGRSGFMGYLGTGGLRLSEIEANILQIQAELKDTHPYGMNLLSDPTNVDLEERTVDLYLKHGVRFVEAAAYIQMTPALVRYRLTGARRVNGRVVAPHHVMAKVSRPEVAETFMRPAPPAIVDALLRAGRITPAEADVAHSLPVAGEVCVEADSGGHTDQGIAYVLMPAIIALRDRISREQDYQDPIYIGAAGGIGTPHAAAAAFILGADFIVTGSINQCTVEAATSDAAKDLLETINVQDTAYAPAGDLFEIGARIQVLRKGVLFPARANKLYELYLRHGSLDEIDEKTRSQIQERYFQRSFDEIWAETEAYYRRERPDLLAAVEGNPKRRMAAIFKWYFVHTTRLAMAGEEAQRANFQIHCGPALGAFNQWVMGTDLERWRDRRVAEIGHHIMGHTAALLDSRCAALSDAA
jgi:trans-AT polyketide synthase/acyltransferase/oxidoreductase domain-containing protein